MIPVDSFHAFHVSIVSSESVKGRESEGKEMDGGRGGEKNKAKRKKKKGEEEEEISSRGG